MDALNFGTECWFQPRSGKGAWVRADLENGLFAGGNGSWAPNTGRNSAFVTAMLKNNGTTTYAIKDGNAHKGSIVLGTGGDNSTAPPPGAPEQTCGNG